MATKKQKFYETANEAINLFEMVETSAERYAEGIIRQQIEANQMLNKTIDQYNQIKLDYKKQIQEILIEDKKLSEKVIEAYSKCMEAHDTLTKRLKEWEDGEER